MSLRRSSYGLTRRNSSGILSTSAPTSSNHGFMGMHFGSMKDLASKSGSNANHHHGGLARLLSPAMMGSLHFNHPKPREVYLVSKAASEARKKILQDAEEEYFQKQFDNMAPRETKVIN